jgi:hypothetical protein
VHQPDGKAKAWLDNIVASANSGHAIPDSVKDNLDNRVPFHKRVVQAIDGLTPEQKIHSGMNFLISGLCAASAFRQLSNSLTKDERGERHIQPTQLGLGIVSALLAAGTAYLGAQAFRAGAAR